MMQSYRLLFLIFILLTDLSTVDGQRRGSGGPNVRQRTRNVNDFKLSRHQTREPEETKCFDKNEREGFCHRKRCWHEHYCSVPTINRKIYTDRCQHECVNELTCQCQYRLDDGTCGTKQKCEHQKRLKERKIKLNKPGLVCGPNEVLNTCTERIDGGYECDKELHCAYMRQDTPMNTYNECSRYSPCVQGLSCQCAFRLDDGHCATEAECLNIEGWSIPCQRDASCLYD